MASQITLVEEGRINETWSLSFSLLPCNSQGGMMVKPASGKLARSCKSCDNGTMGDAIKGRGPQCMGATLVGVIGRWRGEKWPPSTL